MGSVLPHPPKPMQALPQTALLPNRPNHILGPRIWRKEVNGGREGSRLTLVAATSSPTSVWAAAGFPTSSCPGTRFFLLILTYYEADLGEGIIK